MTDSAISLVLPSSGLNYLWQMGGIRALHDLGVVSRIKSVYGSSGGAWASIFLALGKDALDDWLSKAPAFYVQWHRQNRYRYLRRMTCALKDDSSTVLDSYGFFDDFSFPFRCSYKLLEIYPRIGERLIDVTSLAPPEIHRLAMASSTIPLITGTLARIQGRAYIDSGFRYGFWQSELEPSQSAILLDPYSRHPPVAQIHIRPEQPLLSGLRLGLPFTISKQEINALIQQGYSAVMNHERPLRDL